MWKTDHPNLEDSAIQSPNDKVPPASNISSEGAMSSEGATSSEAKSSPEGETSDFGRGMDGCSCHLNDKPRPKYSFTLGDKQIPIAVRNELRISKKKRHQWKMDFHHRKGDAMLRAQSFNAIITNSVQESSDDLPSIDDIMKCPLSKFIHFDDNDCGYCGTRRKLVVNWIHPLFLKTKSAASKEDNPSWKDTMNGDFKVEFWEAALAEIKTLDDMDSWNVIDRTNDMNVLASIWAFKIKRFPDGLIKKFKARFCARGDHQLEGIDFFETYAFVVQWTTVCLLLILEVLLKLNSKQGNVTAAFLRGEL